MLENLQELIQWLVAFQSDRSLAFYHCPEPMYSELRAGYIDIQHDLTDKGHEVLRCSGCLEVRLS